MKTIRQNCFETNSSSTHSLCIGVKSELSQSYLTVDDDDDLIHVEFGEFGWGYDKTNDQYDKLSYLVTMLVETNGRSCKSKQELIQTDGFNLINDVIKEYCNCKGIWIDSKFEISSWSDDYMDHDGWIDHQSCENYYSITSFLTDYGITAEEFIFNSEIYLIIDNDNH